MNNFFLIIFLILLDKNCFACVLYILFSLYCLNIMKGIKGKKFSMKEKE